MSSSTVAHGYRPSLVKTVQLLIDGARDGTLAPITAYEDICDILRDEHIMVERTLDTDEVLVHTANRGTLGLNGYNVHRNGFELTKVGCDPKEMNKAAAFERSPLEPKKSEQLGYNEKQIDLSRGMLAPLTGKESVLSVGTGHTTAFFRAVKFGCKTPIKEMADENGKLNAEQLKRKDARLRKYLECGYTWRVFCWLAEIAWPQLADLCQRALNAAHGVGTKSTELEIMITIACLESDRVAAKSKQTFAEMVTVVSLSAPPCASYITKVGRLAALIGGGPGNQMLQFLNRFSKGFGESRTLGEEFVGAVADIEMSKTQKVTYTRAALVATNLVSTKVSDGVAKLIVKSDVDRLKGQNLRDSVIDNDDRIKQVWNTALSAMTAGDIDEGSFDRLVGQYMVRSMLLLLQKQKLSAEKCEYVDLDAVRVEFIKSIRSVAGDAVVELGEWAKIDTNIVTTVAQAPASSSAKTADTHSVMLSPEEQSMPMHLFTENGFKLGGFVKEKGVASAGNTSDTYKVIKLTDDGVVHLRAVDPFLPIDQLLVVRIELSKFLKNWSNTGAAGTLTQILTLPAVVDATERFNADLQRSQAFGALLVHERSQKERSLLYTICPHAVYASEAIAKHALRLAPLTHIVSLFTEKKSTCVAVHVGKTPIYATSLPRPSNQEDVGKYSFVPYWWVENTTEEAAANMHLASVKIDNVSFPVLQNTRALKLNERLLVFKKKVIKAPLANALADAPAPKKRK